MIIKLAIATLLTLVIKGGVALADHWIAWWLAAVIALAVTFGGFWIIDTDGGFE